MIVQLEDKNHISKEPSKRKIENLINHFESIKNEY